MGSNNNNNSTPPNSPTNYGPNAGQSGGDPRGRVQNQSQWQQQRYENQQGPLAQATATNYGRATESDFANYNNIMDQFQQQAGPGGGYAEFARTGGYSPQDIANMRARGVAPIRTAYANAQRQLGQQRTLQGGYSPNAVATLAKMAREQGQAGSDAATNVEATLADARNKGRLAGLGGITDTLKSMGSLYGTTPGMSSTFGNQAINTVGQGGEFGLGLINADAKGEALPGAWDTTTGRIGQVANIASPFVDQMEKLFNKPAVLPTVSAIPQQTYTGPSSSTSGQVPQAMNSDITQPQDLYQGPQYKPNLYQF